MIVRGDTKRETNLENEMKIVRRMIFPWPDLTIMFLTSRESTCLTVRKILDVMSECEDDMDRSQNTDLCVLLVVKNCDYMTCEIVASLIDFIFEKNMFVCRDFLFWLNCRFYVYSNVVEIKDCLNLIFSDFITNVFKTFSTRFYTKRLINEFVSPVVFGFNIWTRPQTVVWRPGDGC